MRVVTNEIGIEKAAVESNVHLHCYTCINFKICLHKKIDVNCSVGPCPLKCGFIFHQCKLLEHRMLCANEKVPCINYVNGCPVVIVRHKMAKHLETCPANVVVCTAEWNRWPAYYKKQLSHTPVQHFRKGQLDVDMLLRDQRALNDWLKTPLKCRKYFCNNLTPDLPPVPVPFVSQKVQATLPPVCNKANEDLNHVQQYSLEQQHMKTCKLNTLCEELSELVPSIMSQKYQSNETNEGVSNEEKELKNVVLFRNSENGSEMCSVPNKLLKGDSVPEPPQDPPLPPLCLNIMIESISRHQHKPRNMYTFVCAQFFRRDEYAGHYKDVHCEIQCGLNGWLEHRCPLAHYGCPFSLRRLYPCIKGLKITYSEEQESFAIKQRSSEENILSNSRSQVELSTFPSEVLLHICHFLDSFSLSSLSMTCTRMQDVCSSLLVERGIVVLPWEKTTDSKLSWKQAEKKWLFSTAFTPVHVWGLEDEGNMSNHLLKCSYNDRVVNEKPYTHFKSRIPVELGIPLK